MNTFKRTLVILVMCLPIQPIAAYESIGEITINGETVPSVWFWGFSQHVMTDETRCAPTSDLYLRDTIIRRAIKVFDGRKRGLAISDRDRSQIEKFQQDVEYQAADGDPKVINKAEYLKLYYEYNSYSLHFPATVTRTQVLDEYKRLIKEKDPRFTNVLIARHTPLSFDTPEETAKALKMLQTGSSISEVESAFKYAYIAPHLALHWTSANDIRSFNSDGPAPETGTISQAGETDLIYFNEVKYRSRLRPFNTYRKNDNYVYEKIDSDLTTVAKLKRDKALWQAADIREDGKLIEMADSYPDCP